MCRHLFLFVHHFPIRVVGTSDSSKSWTKHHSIKLTRPARLEGPTLTRPARLEGPTDTCLVGAWSGPKAVKTLTKPTQLTLSFDPAKGRHLHRPHLISSIPAVSSLASTPASTALASGLIELQPLMTPCSFVASTVALRKASLSKCPFEVLIWSSLAGICCFFFFDLFLTVAITQDCIQQ